ncbi:hypothetical protein PIB30_050711 [Stylosanthes scabra]|uniref:Uncharacterized protein n=1 Tax=Stylosanthes scabra TaxID=79078 RepID=A0ABU6VG79_9FABA|nr:hypothetical protein [Stylosanthes scabra]
MRNKKLTATVEFNCPKTVFGAWATWKLKWIENKNPANKKAISSKAAHGSSLQTPITFNTHKRRRPPSLQNSPVELVQDKNTSIPTPAGVPNTEVSHTETALSVLVHTCPGMSDGGTGSSVQVPSSLEGKSASAKSSGLKHEPSSMTGDQVKKGDKQLVSNTG